MKGTTSCTTELGIGATRRCIQEWGGDRSQIGLLIASTETPDQMLPCLASEVLRKSEGLFPRAIRTVSMMPGGFALEKSIEVARWFLSANPAQLAIILMAESGGPAVAPLLRNQYSSPRRFLRWRKQHKLDLEQFVVQSVPFSDGAVALLVGGRSADIVNYAFAEPLEGLGIKTYDASESLYHFIQARSSPPSLAEKLLLLFLSKNDRENLIGDLAEEYIDIELRHGHLFAGFWYWKQAMASVYPLIKKAFRWSLFAWLAHWIRGRI